MPTSSRPSGGAGEAVGRARSRWTSFVAPVAAPGRVVRALHEDGNPQHRLRVEHDAETLLIHLSDEDGAGWPTFAVERSTRRWVAAQGGRQADTARDAWHALHGAGTAAHARASAARPAPRAARRDSGSRA